MQKGHIADAILLKQLKSSSAKQAVEMITLEELSHEIAADCTSGSSLLAEKFLERLAKGNFSAEEFHNSIRLILESHPDMAILKHAARILRKVPQDRIAFGAREFLSSLRRTPRKIAEYTIKVLPERAIVMTFSHSGTVLQALLLASRSGKLGSVILSEGRPDMEGHTLAVKLVENEIDTTLTTDCALATLMESVDVVLVGADAVTPEHIINKVGTLSVALAANYADKPIYVLAATHKFTRHSVPRKSVPPERIWENYAPGVRIAAPLFERIPIALFRSVICERGQVGIEEIEMIIE